MTLVPGLALALGLALAGDFLSRLIGVALMGLPKSPVSAITMAILLGIVLRNTVSLPESFKPGIRFGLVRVLRVGIVLLGIRLSLVEVGTIGLQSLPIILAAVVSALLIMRYLARKVGLTRRLGTLIAVGTSICGTTAIVATAPAIGARDHEVSYSIACITLFGVVAMLVYPFVGHWFFSGDAFSSGLFLGTSVHETAQVAGAGLVYQQYYDSPQALDVATVTKLVRNMSMLAIIPIMSVAYHRQPEEAVERPHWWTMMPLFVIGFACMSLIRTIGDAGDPAFGLMRVETWQTIVTHTRDLAEICLAVAMAAVGLETSVRGLINIGMKPLGIGLFTAVLVGGVSLSLIAMLY